MNSMLIVWKSLLGIRTKGQNRSLLEWIQGWEFCALGKRRVNRIQRERQASQMLHTWTTVHRFQTESHPSVNNHFPVAGWETGAKCLKLEVADLVYGPRHYHYPHYPGDLRSVTPEGSRRKGGMGTEKPKTNNCPLPCVTYSHTSSLTCVSWSTVTEQFNIPVQLKILPPLYQKRAN